MDLDIWGDIDRIFADSERVFVAYRAWECRFEHDKEGNIYLRSTGVAGTWRQAEVIARCDRCVEMPPNPTCGCGIYAMKEPKLIKPNIKDDWVWRDWNDKSTLYIFGALHLWGKIIEGELGYKAQYAKIRELYVPTRSIIPKFVKYGKEVFEVHLDLELLKKELSASYGVPVYEDTKGEFYWELPEVTTKTERHVSGGKFGGKRTRSPQYDTKTGIVYKSKAKAGMRVAAEYGLDSNNSFAWYGVIKAAPFRFRDATVAEINDHNKANPFNRIDVG